MFSLIHWKTDHSPVFLFLHGPPFSLKHNSIEIWLINNPAIILADEPTGNLDSKAGDEIVSLLKMSNKKYNQTIIVITHDLEIAKQADRVITIEDGKVIKDEQN